MSERYNTPEQGTIDWHVPLNDNFEKLNTDVEVRDTDANRDQYEPLSGRKYLATDTLDVYLGDGNQWTKVGNIGESSTGFTPTSGQTLTSSLAEGNLVVVAPDTEAHISRYSSTTPVQDAIDAVASADGSGTVYLPPGLTRDEGPISFPTGAQGIHLQGTGASTPSQKNTVIEVSGSNPGMEISAWGSKHTSMDGLTLKGVGQSHPGLHFSGGTTPRMFNIGRLRLDNWGDSQHGAIHFDGAHTFSCHWDSLMFATSNSGPCLYMSNDKPNFVEITNMYADHKGGRHPVINCQSQSPNLKIGLLNVGGDHDQVGLLDSMTYNGQIQIDYCNYEPNGIVDSGKPVFKSGGAGYLQVDCLSVNGWSGMQSVQSAFEVYTGNERIGRVVERGLDSGYDRNKIDIQGEMRAPSFYFGPSSDVVNNSGASTGLFRTLATAGASNG